MSAGLRSAGPRLGAARRTRPRSKEPGPCRFRFFHERVRESGINDSAKPRQSEAVPGRTLQGGAAEPGGHARNTGVPPDQHGGAHVDTVPDHGDQRPELHQRECGDGYGP